jgi:hypothetical protein
MPLFGEPVKYIHFCNDTDFPVNIGSWVDGSNTMSFARIPPRKTLILHSSVGEWHMDSMLDDDHDQKIWLDAGLGNRTIIGKFRSEPCASGNYSWLEYDEPFDCIYSEFGDPSSDIKGLITFTIHTPK